MRIAVGADHGGYSIKDEIIEMLRKQGHEVEDAGAYAFDPADDYPDFTKTVAESVASGKSERGIVICGSGVGACVAANKVRGVRAGLCHDTYSAHQGVEHDDMNVLCLGARVVGIEVAKELVAAYISARFSGDERHKRRMSKVAEMEKSF